MIQRNYTIDKISKETGLSYRQVFHRITQLENAGYVIKREYDTNGNIIYHLEHKTCYMGNEFILLNEHKKLKIMAISDLHVGNIKCDEEAINTIYEYCLKNDIHVIVVCGDIVDGCYSRKEILIKEEKQVDHLINLYPSNNKIITLVVAGDHDYSLYTGKRMSLYNALDKRRHDIVPLSRIMSDTKKDVININGNKILVSHKASPDEKNNIKDYKLHLSGHKHASKTKFTLTNGMITPNIVVPTLSRTAMDQINFPRAVELSLSMNDNYDLQFVRKKELMIINNRVLTTSETYINYTSETLDMFDNEIFGDPKYEDSKENTYDEKKEHELGELSDEAKQKLLDFFGSNKKDKSLEKKIQKSGISKKKK